MNEAAAVFNEPVCPEATRAFPATASRANLNRTRSGIYFRQNVRVKITRQVNSSMRPRNIAAVQTQV